MTNKKERKKLESLATGPADELEAWRRKNDTGRGLLRLLEEFPGLRGIGVVALVEALESIKQRWYSLASLPRKNAQGATVIDLLVSPEHYSAAPDRMGLCCGYLNNVALGSPVTCVHRSVPAMRQIRHSKKPLVMVGCGCGIAPFRTIWQSREKFGELYLFFGCRTRSVCMVLGMEFTF